VDRPCRARRYLASAPCPLSRQRVPSRSRSPFRAGPHGPKRKPGRSRDAFAFCAAAPGTTTLGTAGPPTATGTTPTTGTTMSGSAWPARPRSARAGAFMDAAGVQEGVQDRS
jgi:hypothetical protein